MSIPELWYRCYAYADRAQGDVCYERLITRLVGRDAYGSSFAIPGRRGHFVAILTDRPDVLDDELRAWIDTTLANGAVIRVELPPQILALLYGAWQIKRGDGPPVRDSSLRLLATEFLN